MQQIIRQRLGLWRSLLIYYGIPFRGQRMAQFYRPFIRPGDLCFDIGAHVGNRMRIWLKLGARVVALEPQPYLMNFLQRWYGNRKDVTLLQVAAGAEKGQAKMHISRLTPTVASLSQAWINSVSQDHTFAAVKWDDEVLVQLTTLDDLIVQFGMPSFCKIDVEGYEAEVLKGLSRPIRVLSFEFIPAAIEVSIDCIAQLTRIGSYEYNWLVGENSDFLSPTWVDAGQMMKMLGAIQKTSQSGDVYARLKDAP